MGRDAQVDSRATMVLTEVHGWVVPQSGSNAGRVYALGQRAVLGGDPSCDIVVGGAAPRHAELVMRANTWTVAAIADAELTLDGRRLGSEPQPISDGARLDLGSTRVIFKCVGRD